MNSTPNLETEIPLRETHLPHTNLLRTVCLISLLGLRIPSPPPASLTQQSAHKAKSTSWSQTINHLTATKTIPRNPKMFPGAALYFGTPASPKPRVHVQYQRLIWHSPPKRLSISNFWLPTFPTNHNLQKRAAQSILLPMMPLGTHSRLDSMGITLFKDLVFLNNHSHRSK